MSTQWLYKIVQVSESGLSGLTGVKTDTVQTQLIQLGAQGWELVCAIHPPTMHAVWLYLKKPK
jgi:Domain of unknown function (DUF4177)